MLAYDPTLFEPPAPVAHVVVRDPGGGSVVSDVPMLLDSGADVTLLPATVIRTLGMMPINDTAYELIGFDGSISRAAVVHLELIFARRTFRRQFALIEQAWGIIGRNVLNTVAILLDEPALAWSEAASGRPRVS